MQFSQCFSQSWQAGAHDSPQRLRHKKKGAKEREEEIVVNKGKVTDVCVCIHQPHPEKDLEACPTLACREGRQDGAERARGASVLSTHSGFAIYKKEHELLM